MIVRMSIVQRAVMVSSKTYKLHKIKLKFNLIFFYLNLLKGFYTILFDHWISKAATLYACAVNGDKL